jgi:glycerol-3-phosphate dehydrogenase
MCAEANRGFEDLCRDLGVRFSRCGSLMAAFGPRAEKVLYKKLGFGEENGVEGLKILSRKEVLELEPGISADVTAALYAPGTGTVDPWELGIAAFENAKANGAEFYFGREVKHMEREEGGFLLETERETFHARTVINCAGLSSDAVREMLMVPSVRIFPTAADYLVLDDTVNGNVNHVIFHEPEEKGKGLTLVPTVDGNLLVGPTDRDLLSASPGATDREGLKELEELCKKVVPSLPISEQIRNFSAIRPNSYNVTKKDGVWIPTDRSINDFTILSEEGLISLIGIKTPGLSCAAELGKHAAGLAEEYLGHPGPNPCFDPVRKAPPRLHGMQEEERAALIKKDPDYGRIVCLCGDISYGEVRDAIRRGAVTLDGVKRRAGTGMGRCQGARCIKGIIGMLAKAQSVFPEDVTKDGAGSEILEVQP